MKRIFYLLISIFLALSSSAIGPGGDVSTPYNTNIFIPLITEDVSGWNKTKPGMSHIGPNNEIVFLWKNIENYSVVGIYIMSSNGSNLRLLYANKNIDISFTGPKFSPDRNMIVFCMTHIGLALLTKNNTNWEDYNITFLGGGSYPSFSWDGKHIIFSTGDIQNMTAGVGIINLTSKEREYIPIGNMERSCDFPSFSPDSEKIIYMPFGEGGNYELWIMCSDGSNKKRLLDESWYPNEACFTPDGRILFTSAKVSPHSNRLEDGNIWMMNMDGSNKILVIPTEFNNDLFSNWPAINKNGTIIVFDHGLSKYAGIYKVEDPTGEWKDSDGDGVWDGIDGAPFDPNAGYIKDEIIMPSLRDLLCWSGVLVLATFAVVIPLVFILVKKKRK